jgi:hypothetical protein
MRRGHEMVHMGVGDSLSITLTGSWWGGKVVRARGGWDYDHSAASPGSGGVLYLYRTVHVVVVYLSMATLRKWQGFNRVGRSRCCPPAQLLRFPSSTALYYLYHFRSFFLLFGISDGMLRVTGLSCAESCNVARLLSGSPIALPV